MASWWTWRSKVGRAGFSAATRGHFGVLMSRIVDFFSRNGNRRVSNARNIWTTFQHTAPEVL
jgi:hypothetical protein